MIKQSLGDKDMEMNKVIETFSKNKATQDLAKSLEQGDVDKIRNDIANTAKALQNLEDTDLENFKEDLRQLAQTLKSDPELASALVSISDKIFRGELGDMDKEFSALAEGLERLAKDEEFRKVLDDVTNQLSCTSCHSEGNQGLGQGQ